MMKFVFAFLAAFGLSLSYAAETPKPAARVEKAVFAAGCFWCIQPYYDQTPGVLKTMVGYTGGRVKNPTYKQVSSGKTGHAEAIEVTYDPSKVSYEKLLDIFWHNIDPTTRDGQFPDRGPQYRTAIFYQNEEQRKLAVRTKEEFEKSERFGAPLVTQIEPAAEFWPAEDYHQQYYRKSPEAYQQYNDNSGRKEYFKRIWGK
jgi:peptide-methionine (S)-S-oxide reductase